MNLVEALNYLRPNAQWSLNGDDLAGLTWLDSTQTRPTDEEISNAMRLPTRMKPTVEDFRRFAVYCFSGEVPELQAIFYKIKDATIKDSAAGRLAASAYQDFVACLAFLMIHDPPESGGYGLAINNLVNAIAGTSNALTEREKRLVNDALERHNLARVLQEK